MEIFVSLINLCGLHNAKAILVEKQQWYYLTHSRRYKEVHTFLKGINSKVNVIAPLGFEFAWSKRFRTPVVL